MGLINDYVELKLSPTYINYFKKTEYKLPMNDYGNGEYHVDISKTIQVKVDDLPKGSNVLVDVECDNPSCRRVHKVRYYNYKKMMDKYNGVYCRECVLSIFVSGNNHPCWDPLRTNNDRLVKRDMKGYEKFIKAVLNRDNNTCQCCGATDKKNVVHHLNGYIWCVEQRVDPKNGVTLCVDCHKEFHSIYGYGGNTEEQFNEWINKKQSDN